jgi:transcriptional regulator with XRE-family HTH domain
MEKNMTQAELDEMSLREEIRRRLEDAMARRGIKTQKDAAEELGVTPARLNIYMKKKATPSAFFLMTACRRWNLKIEFDGIEFIPKKIPDNQRLRKGTQQQQLPLFSALKELDNQNLGVRIEKKALDRLELNVEIRFAS